MKNKLTIILLLCSLCLAICACNMNALDEDNQSDSTEMHTNDLSNEESQGDSTEMPTDALTNEENQSDSTEMPTDALTNEESQNVSTETSTDHLLDDIVKPEEGDRPLLTLEFEDAYTEFINSTELPADFVSYDEIAAIGAFRGLVILSDAYTNDYSSYLYTLVDSEGFEISLYVDHNEKILSTANPVSNVNQTDMRMLSDTSRGVYTSNGLTYKYVSGELLSISWKNQNITYTLCASGAPMLSDYPLAESTFVGKMLNLTTIPVSNDQVVIK